MAVVVERLKWDYRNRIRGQFDFLERECGYEVIDEFFPDYYPGGHVTYASSNVTISVGEEIGGDFAEIRPSSGEARCDRDILHYLLAGTAYRSGDEATRYHREFAPYLKRHIGTIESLFSADELESTLHRIEILSRQKTLTRWSPVRIETHVMFGFDYLAKSRLREIRSSFGFLVSERGYRIVMQGVSEDCECGFVHYVSDRIQVEVLLDGGQISFEVRPAAGTESCDSDRLRYLVGDPASTEAPAAFLKRHMATVERMFSPDNVRTTGRRVRELSFMLPYKANYRPASVLGLAG